MNTKVYSITYFIFAITLSFYALGVFAIEVEISAHVPGCGDEIIETSRGEQCEGLNLDGATCSSLGYDTGNVVCNTACTFDVSSCTYRTTSSGSSSKKVTFLSDIFGEQGEGVLIFSGKAIPNSWVIVLNGNRYFHSTLADKDGNFRTAVTQHPGGDYSFVFYSISENQGISAPSYFETNLENKNIIEIKNISIPVAILIPQEEFRNQELFSLPKATYTQLAPLVEYFYPDQIFINEEELSIFRYLLKHLDVSDTTNISFIDLVKNSSRLDDFVSPVICFNDPKNREIFSVYSGNSIDLKTRVEYQTIPRWKKILLKLRNLVIT
jgi:hypothetical protein